MDSSEEDDPGLLTAVKDSLYRQVAELRLRIIEQSERNLTVDLQLRDAFDQEKTKQVLKTLRLKRQLAEAETSIVTSRTQWDHDLKSLETRASAFIQNRICTLRREHTELCKLRQLFSPLVYRTPRRPQRAILEESTAQEPDTPFILETPGSEQVPTTPESQPKPNDHLENLQAEVEDKVAALLQLLTSRLELVQTQLLTLDGDVDVQDTTVQRGVDSTPATESMVEAGEGDQEVTLPWMDSDRTPGEVATAYQAVQPGDPSSAELSHEELSSAALEPAPRSRGWRQWFCPCLRPNL